LEFEKLAIVYVSPPLSPPAQREALDPSLATFKGRPTGMDSNERRSRQNTGSGYAGQQGALLQPQTSPQYPAVSGADRYRQQPQQSAAATAGRTGGSISGYSYPYAAGAGAQPAAAAPGAAFAGAGAGSSIQAGGLQYPPAAAEYGAGADASGTPAQRGQPGATPTQQQPQPGPYQQYAGMYNVQQQQAATPPSPYESVQPYQPRQSAAIEVLTNQFGVPQSYYVGGEAGGPTSTPTAGMPAQNVQPQYSAMAYTTQSPVGRDSMASAYATGMTDSTQAASSQYGQTGGYGPQPSADLDGAYGAYQNELRRTFESVRDGNLAEAGTTLSRISDWLLSNAEALG
jgi:hypothetical protein